MAGRGFALAVARNAPAVVTVIVIRPRRDLDADEPGAIFFQSLAAPSSREAMPAARAATPERSFASGFILAADGHILTSAHAVHDASEVWVELADGRRFPAAVVGFDRRDDVALLKIDVPGVPVGQVAPQEPVCAGDWVAALGSPFGFEYTVSAGVVSTYPRFLPGGNGVPLIQTDVAVNPGSSGGPLFNAEGNVVGMTSMLYSDTGIFVGLSFAVPIGRVLRAAAEFGKAGGIRRSDVGILLQPVSPGLAQAFGLDAARGALVVGVKPGGAADQAGIRGGDIVLAVNGKSGGTHGELEDEIERVRAGDWMAIEVWRERAGRQFKLRVASAGAEAPHSSPARLSRDESRLGLVLATAGTAGLPPGAYVENATGSSLLAGIEAGDRITAVNDMPVADPAAFDAALARAGAAAVIALRVSRGSVAIYIAVRRIGR
jgi:serine protease Do